MKTIDEQNRAQTPDPKLVGIRGWLIIPAIGLVLGPTHEVIGLLVRLQRMSAAANVGYGVVHATNIVAGIGMLSFMVYASIRFFGKAISCRLNSPCHC